MSRARPLEQTRPSGRARGLVSSPESGDRVRVALYEPGAALADVACRYWAGRWDLRGQAPHTTQLLSDPCVNFVFERGRAGIDARVVGVWTRLWRRTLEGEGLVRGVKLRAGAVRAFVDASAATLANRIVPLRDVFGDLGDLPARVLDPDDHAEGFAAFDAWLSARRRTTDADDVARAIELVDAVANDPDLTSAAELAERADLTPRSLQRLFRDFVGAPPKWVIRRNRLQEVAQRIERGRAPSLAALAAELGYADQAHLTRDFKAVVGCTPRAFEARVRDA